MESTANLPTNSILGSLGSFVDGVYVVNDDCLSTLIKVNGKLCVEDTTERTFRRAIGFGHYVKKEVVPLLVHTKDPNILNMIIRLLANLTTPTEILFPVNLDSKSELGRQTILELNQLLITIKEVFADWKTTEAVIDYMKSILNKNRKLSIQSCDIISNCLLLMRNILYVSEENNVSVQNQILWNLFLQRLDNLLIHLMLCSQRTLWAVTLAQLMSVIYNDQHYRALEKLLSYWNESTLCESSDDNESNTSLPKQFSGTSFHMSNPTSKNLNELEQVTRMSTELSTQIILPQPIESHQVYQQTIETACSSKYNSHQAQLQGSTTTMMQSKNIGSISTNETTSNPLFGLVKTILPSISCKNNYSAFDSMFPLPEKLFRRKESISTTSTEDDVPYFKPPPPKKKHCLNAAKKQHESTLYHMKKELRWKKIVKWSKRNTIATKKLMFHIPTEDDISNILMKFTVNFLLKGYDILVHELHTQLLSALVDIDTVSFLWLITHFLNIPYLLEQDLKYIKKVLSYNIVSFITYNGMMLSEKVEKLKLVSQNDINPSLMRLHLVITAIREVLHVIENYNNCFHLSTENREFLNKLQLQISSTDQMKCLFVLLLQRYEPSLQSKQYLKDLIVTNHSLMLMLDGIGNIPGAKKIDMIPQLRQYATLEIMHHYGLILEDFRDNEAELNDCIFTMMHHVAGDLGLIGVLFQPNILKTFTLIKETKFEVTDEWTDLIEYVISKCIDTLQSYPFTLEDLSLKLPLGKLMSSWTQSDEHLLQWYYVQCKKNKSMVADILQLFEKNKKQQNTRSSIIKQLRRQGIVTSSQYDALMKLENPMY